MSLKARKVRHEPVHRRSCTDGATYTTILNMTPFYYTFGYEQTALTQKPLGTPGLLNLGNNPSARPDRLR
ncbi:hypothetical protein FVER53590_25954 [Fusarium verticillioides]|nr:hypothetical protein FVER53590_25954 [Fusarium verticillioides]